MNDLSLKRGMKTSLAGDFWPCFSAIRINLAASGTKEESSKTRELLAAQSRPAGWPGLSDANKTRKMESPAEKQDACGQQAGLSDTVPCVNYANFCGKKSFAEALDHRG